MTPDQCLRAIIRSHPQATDEEVLDQYRVAVGTDPHLFAAVIRDDFLRRLRVARPVPVAQIVARREASKRHVSALVRENRRTIVEPFVNKVVLRALETLRRSDGALWASTQWCELSGLKADGAMATALLRFTRVDDLTKRVDEILNADQFDMIRRQIDGANEQAA